MMPKCVRTPMDFHCGTLSTTLARSWRGTCSTPCYRCFGELTRCVFPTGERPAFCLDCRPLHGFFSYMCLAVTRLLRDIAAKYSRQPRATTRRYGTTSGPFYLVSRVFARDTPVGQPILIIRFVLLFVTTFNVTDKDAAAIAVDYSGPYGAYNNDGAATVSTTRLSETPVLVTWRRCDREMPPHKPWQCRWVLGLYLRGQAVTSPRVSILRS